MAAHDCDSDAVISVRDPACAPPVSAASSRPIMDANANGRELDDDAASGTSFAAPTVAGAAALLRATTPAFAGSGIGMRSALLDSASAPVTMSCEEGGDVSG